MRNSETFSAFKKSILKFKRTSSNSISIATILAESNQSLDSRLRLDIIHLREHKFRQNFQNSLTHICGCRDEIETSIHYLLHCPNYLDARRILLDNLQNDGENIHDKNDFQISKLLLFGVSSNNDASNTSILNTTIQYTLATKRVHIPLINS